MERNPKTGRPSIFKVLMEDYASRLRVPHAFVQKYGEFLPEIAKLRTSSGETWNVKLDEETYDDENYLCLIGGGWSKFVKDLELKLGEFLVFWFNLGNSITFDVSVFGTDCCEREISAMAVDSDADHQDFEFRNDCHNVPGKQMEDYESGGELSRIKSFAAVVKNHNRFFMDIPKAFALETGIATKRAIRLENEEGKEWVVELPIIKDGRIRMSKGWNDFLVENKVVFGSTCLFEFDATFGNLIMKNEHDIRNMSSLKRGRGGVSESIIVPTKRRRGRPPKSSIVSTKGERGRPPKNITVAMKRGRGRPPKSSAIC